MMMEKHDFVPYEFDRIYCGHDVEPTGSGLPGKLCMNLESDPIHMAQPEQRQNPDWLKEYMETGGVSAQPTSEPESVSDEWREEIISAGTNCFKICVPSEGEKLALEVRALRAQLADRDNHVATAYAALGDVNRSVYLFDHIRKLKEQLAETCAAIKKARRDALEEAALKLEGQGQPGYAAEIRALAAQKKEG